MIIKKRMDEGERLVEIDNVHFANCGTPPAIDATQKYLGYFENTFGEQWVFIGDRTTGKAILRGGDVGWENEHELSLANPCPNLILNESEKMWIITCLMAMSNSSFDEVVANYNKAAASLVAGVMKELEKRSE